MTPRKKKSTTEKESPESAQIPGTNIGKVKRFIAIDTGTLSGYCVFDGLTPVESGRINLGRGLRAQYTALRTLVDRFVKANGVELVAYEATDWFKPAFPRENPGSRAMREKINRQVQRALGRKEGMIEALAFELGIFALPITVHEAKRAITGNGNASKVLVAQEVRKVFGGVIPAGATQDEIDSYSVAAAVLDKFADSALWRITMSDGIAQKQATEF